jgi:hypothetical protein
MLKKLIYIEIIYIILGISNANPSFPYSSIPKYEDGKRNNYNKLIGMKNESHPHVF